MKDPKAKLEDIYYNIIKHIDEHTPAVNVNRVYLGLSADKGFYTFVFEFGAGGIEIEFYHDELQDTDIYTTIFKRFYSKYRNSSYDFIQHEYEQAHELKEFLNLFPDPILTYYHTGPYQLKKGDKLLYKQYISEVLYIDEDGDIELKVGESSNCYVPRQLSGFDIIFISPKPKKQDPKDMLNMPELETTMFKREYYGTWVGASPTKNASILYPEIKSNEEDLTKVSIKETTNKFKELAKKAGLLK